MLRISNKTKFIINIITKIIVTMLVGCSLMVSLVLVNYKFVYSVKLNNEDVGFVGSKASLEKKVNDYIQYGDGIENMGYILLNTSPEYELTLAKKDVTTSEDEIYGKIKENSEVYYKVYAVESNEEEVCIAKTLSIAQEIVDGVNNKQKNYRQKADITIVEKYVKEYESVEDSTVAIADIVEPIKKENDALVKKYTTYSSDQVVSSTILASLKATVADLNFSTPVSGYIITSRYGWRRNGTEFHTGLDFAVSLGTPIHAVEDGIVTCAKWSGNYGYLVKVQHTGGYETYYAHCSRFNVTAGQEVKKGDVIAYVGSTGKSTGPHVHLEIRLDGKSLNPQDFI